MTRSSSWEGTRRAAMQLTSRIRMCSLRSRAPQRPRRIGELRSSLPGKKAFQEVLCRITRLQTSRLSARIMTPFSRLLAKIRGVISWLKQRWASKTAISTKTSVRSGVLHQLSASQSPKSILKTFQMLTTRPRTI